MNSRFEQAKFTQPRIVALLIVILLSLAVVEASRGAVSAAGVDGVVLTPDGKPAAAAKVVVLRNGSFLNLENGEDDQTREVLHRCETDRSGRFQFRLREERFGLVITHPTGYAIFQPVPHSKHRWITLDPWTRIEGTLQAGGKPVPDTTVSIDRAGRYFRSAIDLPEVSVTEAAKTDANGRFVFARVLSGSGTVSCQLPQRPGLPAANFKSMHAIETNFPLGRTVHLEFGRHCRTVVGTLRAPPDLKMRPEWRLATIELQGANTSGDRQTREFKGPPEKDGTFRIDNVPLGRWTLSIDYINYTRDNPWRLYLRHAFSVSEPDDEPARDPLDLKELNLEKK
jgi:hypothetical protein